jgi:hypothetical protein
MMVKFSRDESADNEIQRGGFAIQKNDSELEDNTPQGNAKLNATYRLVNKSDKAVWIDTDQDFEGDTELAVNDYYEI